MLDSTSALNQNSFQTFTEVAATAPQSLFRAPALPQCEISVAIPVRDEAENLDATLRAVTRQLDLSGNKLDPRRYEILIFANNCQDDSAAVVRHWQLKTTFPPIHLAETDLPPAAANCGRARQIALDAAFARLKKLGKRRSVIATTDGDTRVAPDWIAATLLEIERGADAVSGRIIVEPSELNSLDEKTRRFHLTDVSYRHLVSELESYLAPVPFDPRPRHHQHFNASFAVTIEAYQRAGGVPAVTHLEDLAFYQSLLRVDARFRHSPQVRVFTSARRNGRTACGLSTQLAEWTNLGERREPYLVEDLGELEARFASIHELRQLWQRSFAGDQPNFKEINLLAENLRVNEFWLNQKISASQTFGRLREAVEREQRADRLRHSRYSLVPIETAMINLRLRLEQLRRSI